ncbi:rhodanese-like domain-containing protein [Hanstruepera neustonica]|uniref:Rhodanese-like domain-containing protein n=1 Tax=Hanstruepera neustonica TaxID=1445657 RepID=A0A2K1E0F7_9FLAO|nr:rhodanese-like domain-containing protein [Hanstruepera neustonica]PNQ73767.1 rhodanese-like domain-containing protein [Hanstruepera neustonica]
MKKNIVFVALLMMIGVSSCKKEEKKGEVKVVSVEEMQSLMELDDIQLVDVRTPGEYAEGYIENFQNIDFLSPTFDEDIAKLDKNKPVILYCKSGGRSASCAKKMVDAGFVKVYDLEGGISKWQHEGMEVKVVQ